jgi:hypothetical protein
MGPTERLIREYAQNGHKYGKPVHYDDIPTLVNSLRNRLNVTETDLDFSPSSLKRLETLLVQYCANLMLTKTSMDECDTINLVREITAYIGNTLIIHANGRWCDDVPDLWSNEIMIDGPWLISKDTQFSSSYPASFIIGGEAAWTWDIILAGSKPGLYRMYRDAKKRRLREFYK